MLTQPDFIEQKVVLVFSKDGEKVSFKNDNLIITDKEGNVKCQYSCYKIFIVYIIGGFTITTGVIERSKRFGFSIVLLTSSFKVYETINFKMEGNTLLRLKQYTNKDDVKIGKYIIINKIENQICTLKLIRNAENKETIKLLNVYRDKLIYNELSTTEIMGIEGVASKIYFRSVFKELDWQGRQPRVKRDKINLLLDIGYTILFNFIEAIINIYGFDVYKGNLHKEFYKRKSLICDIIEPFRTIIDYRIRKGFNLKQFEKFNFLINRGKYDIDWKDSSKYIKIILEEIIKNKVNIFEYIQKYYRWFMKDKDFNDFPKVRLKDNDID